MTANETLTLVMSGLSFGLSVVVAIYSWRKDRVHLRLIPGFVVKPPNGGAAVCQQALPPEESGCQIQGYILDVINVGNREATIYELGFRVKCVGQDRFDSRVTRGRKARVPFVDAKTTLGGKVPPIRLQPADRVSFNIPLHRIEGGASAIIDAYVGTGYGKFFNGSNRALQDFCTRAKRSNFPCLDKWARKGAGDSL